MTEAGADVDTTLVGRRVGWLAGQGSFADTVVVDAADNDPFTGPGCHQGEVGSALDALHR